MIPQLKFALPSHDYYDQLLLIEEQVRDGCFICGITKVIFELPGRPIITWDFTPAEPRPSDLNEVAKSLLSSSDFHRPDPLYTPITEIDGFRFSPIEATFYEVLKETKLLFTPQCPVVYGGRIRYRLDFLVHYEGHSVAVELDGHESHKTREQRMRDAARDRFLMARRITTCRFTGSEIYRDPRGCLFELIDCLTGHRSSEI